MKLFTGVLGFYSSLQTASFWSASPAVGPPFGFGGPWKKGASAGEFWFAAVDFPIGGGEAKVFILSKG